MTDHFEGTKRNLLTVKDKENNCSTGFASELVVAIYNVPLIGIKVGLR